MMRRAFVVGATLGAAEEWAAVHRVALDGFEIVEFASPRSIANGRGRGLVAHGIFLLPGVEPDPRIREWAVPMVVPTGGTVVLVGRRGS